MTSPISRRVLTAVLTGSVLIAAVGCGKISEKATEKLVEKGIEAGTGGKVDIDPDSGKFRFENEDGALDFDAEQGGMSFESDDGSFQTGAGMPDGWPEDIPLPSGFEVVSGHSMEEGDSRAVGIAGEADGTPEQIMDFYEDALSSWEQLRSSTSGGDGEDMRTAVYESGNRALTVNAYSDEGGSSVSMQYSEGDRD